jgi:hypothetical protein
MADPPSPAIAAPPPETAAPFTTEAVLGRMARRLELDEGSQIFEFGVHGRSSAVLLARECGCRFTVADRSPEALERVRAEADAAGVVGRLTALQLDAALTLPVPAVAFDLVISPKRETALAELTTRLRSLLVPSKGRLAAVVAARVGSASRDLGPWEKALGGTLRTPQAELAEFTRNGFEPEWAESLSEPQLVELYGASTAPPDEEAALVQAGPAGVSFVLVVGRRREPDESPPRARERG